MTIDDLGRGAADRMRTRLEAVPVPAPRRVVDRARRRQRGRAWTAIATVAIAGIAAVSVASVDRPAHVETVAGLPAGSSTAGRWARVPTDTSGLDPDATLGAIASGDDAVLLVGSRPSGGHARATVWRTTDGLNWTPVEHPVQTGTLRAVAVDGDEAVAVGSSGTGFGASDFVWRSGDGGRTWHEAGGPHAFGPAAPSMGRPYVDALSRVGNRWVAAGAASAGDAGIWTSEDGARWTNELHANHAGSAAVVPVDGERLLAYWVTTAWFTDDPTSWGEPQVVAAPDPYYPQTVAPGASLAFADEALEHGQPTPLLRSTDQGHTWVEDPTFLDRFPDARVNRVDRLEGFWVAIGTSGGGTSSSPHNLPDAWVSADGRTWEALPASLQAGPSGTLGLAAHVDGKVLLLSSAPQLEGYYVRDARRP